MLLKPGRNTNNVSPPPHSQAWISKNQTKTRILHLLLACDYEHIYEFLRLLFLQAHRETTTHFTALGMPAQQRSDSFRYRRPLYTRWSGGIVLAAAELV